MDCKGDTFLCQQNSANYHAKCNLRRQYDIVCNWKIKIKDFRQFSIEARLCHAGKPCYETHQNSYWHYRFMLLSTKDWDVCKTFSVHYGVLHCAVERAFCCTFSLLTVPAALYAMLTQ